MAEIETESVIALTSGRALARNTVWNLIGVGAPLLVALFAIPLLIKGLGTARFGVLTLAWAVVSYFSLFDLGLGRALTKLVAEKLGAEQAEDIPRLICTALALMGVLGIIGALVAASVSPWLVHNILKIPQTLQDETLKAFYLLALSIPVVISAIGLRGVLEAYQRFDIVNAIRVPMGFFTFLGPLAVLPFSKSLVAVVWVLVAGRVVAWCCHLIFCFRVVPALRQNLYIIRGMIKPLLSFGGWLTVSNIVGPALLYADRFFIASMLTVTAVAYYTTPYEVITKLLVIPTAILGVMFPAFSSIFTQNTHHVRHLYHQTIKYMAFIMIPLVVLIFLFSELGLTLWINADFASESFRVAQLLAVGVFINSFGHISQALVQAYGRPDLTAKLHVAELIAYIPYMWWLVKNHGIEGAAIAWTVRVTISTIALAVIANGCLTRTIRVANKENT